MSVVSVVSCHFQNSITTTCCQQGGNKLATSPSAGKLQGNVCDGFWALGCVLICVVRVRSDLCY